jgi:hypothetical protein
MYSDISNINIDFDNTLHVNVYASTGDTNSSSDESNDNIITDKPIMIKVNSDIPLQQDIIQNEPSLQTYTNNHFNTLTNRDLDLLQENNFFLRNDFSYSGSNSPVLSVLDSNHNSNNNSDDDNDSNTKNRFLTRQSNTDKYIKLNTNDIENYVKKFYSNYLVDNYANELDILTTFIRGQKNLYAQSRIITQQKLTLLVFPALIIAACVTIISPFIECDSIDTNIITGLNAIITLFISLVGFLNLESSGEKYLILASLFDNIETNLELASTKLMVMKKEKDISELIVSKFNEVEDKISEYKLIMQILILPEIKSLFPIISHINIFSFIKKTELMKRGLIEKLRDVKNEISYINYKVDRREQIHKIKTSATYKSNEKEPNEKEPIDNENKKELSRLNLLFQLKNTVTNEIIELQNAYTIVDTIFYREISKAEKKQNKWWFCLFCFYWNKSYDNSDYINDLLKGLSPSLKELIIP